MAAALRALGAPVTAGQDGGPGTAPAWLVTPAAHGEPAAGSGAHGAMVDVGNAGTVLRFVPPVAALTTSDVEFRGDDRASARPVRPLLAALRELGATIDDGGRGAIPFTVRGHGRRQRRHRHPGRLRVLPAGVRAAAGRAALRQGRGNPP